MKRTCCLLILFLSAIGGRAQTQNVGKVYLVEVTELTQEKTNMIVTVEAYQSLQTKMDAKNQLLPKAIGLATKEWTEKHPDDGPFPHQTASKGEVKSLGMFNDRPKAEQALKDLLAREEKDGKKKLSSSEKQLEALKEQLSNLKAAKNSNATQQRAQITGMETRIKALEEGVARKQKKDEDRDAKLTVAREIFRKKLQELLDGDKATKPKDADKQ